MAFFFETLLSNAVSYRNVQVF